MELNENPADTLSWLIAMGADEIVLEQPVDRFAESAVKAPSKAAPPLRPVTPPPAAVAPVIAADVSGLGSIAEVAQALNFLDTHPLRKTASRLSFYEGPERPLVLVLSDKPRNDEDKTGEVFAGKTRVLLTNMLAAIGLKIGDVGLMNFMPWRPPGNAMVKDAEALAVVPYMQRAIEILAPRIILAFGTLAGQYLAGADASPIKQRGKWMMLGSVPMLSTFGPDDLLRQPAQKRLAWRDLQLFREKLHDAT